MALESNLTSVIQIPVLLKYLYVTNAFFDGTVSDNAYNFTTEVNAEDASNNTVICVTHLITNYPEKVNVTLGSEATFVANEEVEEYQKDLSGNRIGKKRYKYTTSVDQSFAEFPLEISKSFILFTYHIA